MYIPSYFFFIFSIFLESSVWNRVVIRLDNIIFSGLVYDTVCQWPGRPRFSPRSNHTKDSKNGI